MEHATSGANMNASRFHICQLPTPAMQPLALKSAQQTVLMNVTICKHDLIFRHRINHSCAHDELVKIFPTASHMYMMGS